MEKVRGQEPAAQEERARPLPNPAPPPPPDPILAKPIDPAKPVLAPAVPPVRKPRAKPAAALQALQAPSKATEVPTTEAALVGILSAPPFCEVKIDGKAVGTTPLTNVVLKPGRHRFTLEAPQINAILDTVLELDAGTQRFKFRVPGAVTP
jgi:hypothetical protein